MNNKIRVIAGRPGAGKTKYIEDEIIHLLQDQNNIIFYIGHTEPKNITEKIECDPYRFQFWGNSAASQAIGASIDAAYASDENQRVYVFFEQCRFSIRHGQRDLLVAAAKAGVDITVFVQLFNQVDKNNIDWLNEHCDCMIISKRREPRLATNEEIHDTYRD